jgi:3-deoxy-D-arabino-heptulosonate 7-phosphate (DAHP) synthase
MDPQVQSLFELLRDGIPIARAALKKIKDAKVSAAVESLDSFVNDASSQLLTFSTIINERDRQIDRLQTELSSLLSWKDWKRPANRIYQN